MAAHQAPPSLGFSKARTLERVAISFSNAWKWKVKVKSLSRARLLVTPWTAAYQAPPSVGYSRQRSHCLLQVFSYDPSYFSGISCNFSSFISGFIYLIPLSFFLGLSISFIFSKTRPLVSLIFPSVFLVSISFISPLIFVVSFLLLILGFVYSSFSSSRWKVMWFIWNLSWCRHLSLWTSDNYS